MSSRPSVLLFDIDGTLLYGGGCGRRALERAFTEVTGHSEVLHEFNFGGMTDVGIMRLGLDKLGLLFEPALIERLTAAYLRALADELPRAERFVVMPGASDILVKLAGESGLALGLGTGNLKLGAEAKLRRADLWQHFSFGGFGCDHEHRDELIRMGAERGAALLGLPRSECRVVVIGDTIRDVRAAQAIGAECIAVETGGVSADVLREAGADAVYRDLTDPSALARILGC